MSTGKSLFDSLKSDAVRIFDAATDCCNFSQTLSKSVEYINRKREKYYLKAALTKTGKKRYYVVKDLSKTDPKDLLQEMPVGFEFYEHPREAQVVLRKIPTYLVTDEEVEIVDSVMKNHETISDYIVEKGVDHITIYTGCIDRNIFSDMPDLYEKFYMMQHYEDLMRFEKVKKDYLAQRFCCLSRAYGWITIDRNKDLRYLAEKYCYHIDKDSLFDFWKID